MSEFRIDQITNQSGSRGPDIAGITTFTGTSGMVMPSGATEYRGGRGRGIFGGGRTPYVTPNLVNILDYMTIATLGNALDFGDLYQNTSEFGACASSTRGVFMGGETFPTNIDIIQYITVQSTGNSFDFGDLTRQKRGTSCLSNNTRGICAGGNTAPVLIAFTEIEYVTINTLGNASTFGDASQNFAYSGTFASTTRGVIALGSSPYASPYASSNIVEYITIATTGNTRDFGDLSVSRRNVSAASNSTRGLFFGGVNPTATPTVQVNIDYVTIASLGDAIDFGDCIAGSSLSNACSSPTRAIFGDMTSDGNAVSYVTINTLGDAQDFGDLTVRRNQTAGFSDSHGGLGD